MTNSHRESLIGIQTNEIVSSTRNGNDYEMFLYQLHIQY